MLIPTAIMAALALLLYLVAYARGEGQHVTGSRVALKMTVETLPLLLFSFLVAGLVQVLVPQEIIARWVGDESGLRGIVIGAFAGALAPGGPYVSFPIAATLLQAGASMGTMVAFVTAWGLWSVSRLPLEVGVIGWRFTLIRLVSTVLFPFVGGLIAHLLFRKG